MSAESQLTDGRTEPSSTGCNTDRPGGANLPPLPPGYHFVISLCDVACSREQLDAIKQDLIEVMRHIIREYELRAASGRLANSRVHLSRTVPMLGEEMDAEQVEGSAVTQVEEGAAAP
jgi:hypothetical protein